MELLYPNAVSRDYRYCTYTFLDHTHVHTHVKSISLIRAASQQSFQLCSKKKKKKRRRERKRKGRERPRWPNESSTVHCTYCSNGGKLKSKLRASWLKGPPSNSGSLRDCVTFGQFLRDRGSNKGSISVKKKKKKEDRG